MYGSVNRDLTQKHGWKTQDGRMTKNCRARPGMHSLARLFFRGSAVLSLPAVLLRKVCNGNTWPRGTINFDFILLDFFRFYQNFLFKLRMKICWKIVLARTIGVIESLQQNNWDSRVSRVPLQTPIRELTHQDGWKTQDGRMTKKYGARLCIPTLTRHFFVIMPSWVFQPSCCVSSLITPVVQGNIIKII